MEQEIKETKENDLLLSEVLNMKFRRAMEQRFPTAEMIVGELK